MADTTKSKEQKMYTIRLPKLKGENAQQVEFFSVNGKNYLIERGKAVEVPEELYEVYQHTLDAEDDADAFAEELDRIAKAPKV